MYRKAKIHVEDIAWNGSLKFAFYRILAIINRRIPLPYVIFKDDTTGMFEERYLEEFMIPKNNGCFVDVGASVGHWTLFVAKRGFEVHAFEPSPTPYHILENRTKSYRSINVYRYALGETNSVATLNLHNSYTIDSLVKKRANFIGQTQVFVRTLDSFDFMNVGLIKIDTEGYEVPILLGARKTILEYKPRLIIEVHTPYDEEMKEITKILKELKYRWIVKRKRRFRCANPQPHIIGEPE